MWHRGLPSLLLPLLPLLLPPCTPSPLPGTLRPSRVFYLKMPLTLPYSLSCQPSGGSCKYQSRLDPEKEKKLVAAYSKGGPAMEREKERGGKRGRKVELREERRSHKKNLNPYKWKALNRAPMLNFIQAGDVEEKPWRKKQKLRKVTNKQKPKSYPEKVLRPGVSFLSNARPSLLKWRELKVKKTPIIKAKPIQFDYAARLKQKYGSSVPVHLGYSRNLVEDSPRRFRGAGSSTTWLPSPAKLNGLPQTLHHWQYPLQVARLGSNFV